MPFDGNDYPARPAQPDGAYLVRVLREGPTGPLWPKGCEWNFANPCCCAIGIAGRIWDRFMNAAYLGQALNLKFEVAADVFYGTFTPLTCEDITPAMVADALEAALAQRAEATP